jgi:hypothetical protein
MDDDATRRVAPATPLAGSPLKNTAPPSGPLHHPRAPMTARPRLYRARPSGASHLWLLWWHGLPRLAGALPPSEPMERAPNVQETCQIDCGEVIWDPDPGEPMTRLLCEAI